MSLRQISFIIFFLFLTFATYAQIENVLVETYYLSDANDATDTTGGHILKEGSKTYRVFIDLEKGYKLKRIFGDSSHVLKFVSTDTIYNNIDRPSAHFGYLVNKSWFSANPLLALDSWLSLGLATRTQLGVPKPSDPDSSEQGGTNNGGGSAEIPGGLLVNNDPQAGIPITIADGMVTTWQVLSQWIDNGFKDFNGIDTTVFGSQKRGTAFVSHTAFLHQTAGVDGFGQDNLFLVAQITTKGELKFEMNILVVDSTGAEKRLVARNAGNDETVSPLLSYPAECGCRDAKYLEYKPYYGCDQADSCKTLIVYGCMDPFACNYNPIANFPTPGICCYPGDCDDRDLSIVCPEKSNKSLEEEGIFSLYPNPANTEVNIKFSGFYQNNALVSIQNILGTTLLQKSVNAMDATEELSWNVSGLTPGLYLIVYRSESNYYSRRFIKQ